MTQTQLMSDYLRRNTDILKMTLADFSDQDMLVRPVAGANHAAWQLGHLVGSAAYMVGQVAPGVVPESAIKIGEKCNGKTCACDDPDQFPAKAEMIEILSQVTAAICKWVEGLSQVDLDKPTPGKMADFAPTVGHLALMMASHSMMHVGQMQVIRRKVGKPLLF